jgi:hypothetical protein
LKTLKNDAWVIFGLRVATGLVLLQDSLAPDAKRGSDDFRVHLEGLRRACKRIVKFPVQRDILALQ